MQDDGDPADANGHGTHVTGTLAASGNDAYGIVGVVWRASVIPLRVPGADGSGTVSDIVSAYRYAARSGARIVNASLTGGTYSQAEYDTIGAAPKTLFVVAAGNNGANSDTRGAYPCNYDLPNIMCMAAVDRQDRLAGFSNFGACNVAVAAPGVDVTRTWPGGAWAVVNGTSMATPLTSGVAALLLGYDSGVTVRQLRDRVLAGAQAAPDLAGRVATGGSIDAAGGLRASGASVPDLPDPAPAIGSSAPALPSRAPQTPVRTDRAAPTVRLRVLERRLRTALRRGLTARVACSETCNAQLTLSVAGRSGTSAGARAARLVATRTRAATTVLRLNARARAAARSRGRIRVTVRANVSDRAGNARRATVAVTLRR